MSALEIFKQLGAVVVSTDLLIDAAVPLNLSGEAVRGRICTFLDEQGQEWALRPDLTLPVVLRELKAAAALNEPQARCYSGPVFRLPVAPDEPVEYQQIGLERFGYPSTSADDVEMVQVLVQACQAEGVTQAALSCGDLSIFPAFVDALELPEAVSSALKRAFRQPGGVRAYLAGQESQTQAPTGLSAHLANLPEAEVHAFLTDLFTLTGMHPMGERSLDEIVERLVQKQVEQGQAGLTALMRSLILELLSVDTPLDEAVSTLRDLAQLANTGGVEQVLDGFEARVELIQSSIPEAFLRGARFATRFGRRFTYYDGFVFEFAETADGTSSALPFAAGGRYNSLFHKLSNGQVSSSAIGGILIPHRFPAGQGAAT